MFKLLFLALIFIAVALVTMQLLPMFTGTFETYQKRKLEKTADKLDKMFVDVSRERLFFVFMFAPVILSFIGFLLTQNMLVVVAGFALGIILPQVIVKKMDQIRRAKFQAQLLDAVSILAGALKSGMSFLQAVEVVVDEMPPPLSHEFNLVLNENKLGMTPEETLERLNKRMYSEELNMLVTSILVVRQTGGNLSKIFENLVYTIRQKNKILQQLKNLTVQARAQGFILMFLPFIFVATVTQTTPGFFDALWHSDKGRALMIYACFSQVMGMYLLRRLSKVEV